MDNSNHNLRTHPKLGMVKTGERAYGFSPPFFVAPAGQAKVKPPPNKSGGIARADFIKSYAETFHGATNTPA